MNEAQIGKLAEMVASDEKFKTRFDYLPCDDDQELAVRISKPKPKDYKIADLRLKQWARGYLTHDRRVIVQDTGGNCSGSLGMQVKRNNKDNNIYSDIPFIEIDDTQYRRLNEVMLSMTDYNRMFLIRHYIDRTQHINKYVDSGVSVERAIQIFTEKLGMTKSMYTLDLREAQEEFLLRGGF